MTDKKSAFIKLLGDFTDSKKRYYVAEIGRSEKSTHPTKHFTDMNKT